MIGLDQGALGITCQVQIFFQPVEFDLELPNLLVSLSLQHLVVLLTRELPPSETQLDTG